MAKFVRPQHINDADSVWQGDDLSTAKPDNTTRIMFHNVNGLTLQGSEGIDLFAHEQDSMEVDIQCISEHCLDTTKFQVYQTAQDIIRQTYTGNSLLYLNSSNEPAVNLYKPGGTGFIYAGKTNRR